MKATIDFRHFCGRILHCLETVIAEHVSIIPRLSVMDTE